MHGRHMAESEIYFGGDNRVSFERPANFDAPPAWLVADWMFAQRRGEPLSVFANGVLDNDQSWNEGLKWLRTCLDQYDAT